MKFGSSLRVGAALLLLPMIAVAGDKDTKSKEGQMVDSGSLGVFVNGHRVATETFSIQQNAAGSTITSQFKTDEGEKAVQSSDLELTPTGEIRKYEWKEISPGRAQASVTPNNEFLVEHTSKNPEDKPDEQPFLLPASTNILDDYFFIHREVLIWRYLATACRQEKGDVQCPGSQKTQFGALNPHQRSSLPITMEFTGREKITIRGAERELNKFILRSEGGDWTMWTDNQFKLQKILIPSDNTEVVRD